MQELWRNGGDGRRVYFAGHGHAAAPRKDLQCAGREEPRGILRDLGILPETVIVVQNGKIIPLDYRPKDGEEFELIDVISGG